MTAFSFKEDTILYSKEYAVVKEVERVWRRDLDQFHDAFFARLRAQLEDLKAKNTASTYRYWWRQCWRKSNGGGLSLWHDLYYPELVRDKAIEFFAFINIPRLRERIHPFLQSEAEAALSGIPGLALDRGEPASDKPLTLTVRWKDDPLEEGVPVFIAAMRALDSVAQSLPEF